MSDVVTLTTEELTDSWRDAPASWGHSKHNLSPFVGSFPPTLARYFLEWFSCGSDTESKTVLDPFCGGGTTLLEALLLGNDVIGNDLFQYANVVSKAKCATVADDALDNRVNELQREAERINSSLLSEPSDDISVFFSDSTLDQLVRLQYVLQQSERMIDTYIKALVCGILHGPSQLYLSVPTKDSYATSPNAMRNTIKENDLVAPERNVFENIKKKHEKVSENPFSHTQRVQITNADVRNLSIQPNSVDMILTSPPYMQVLDYTWNNWLRVWWLGNNRKSEQEKLVLTASENKYRIFVRETLKEMERVLTDNGVIVIVVGDVKKQLANKTELINTARLFIEEASETGLVPQMIVNDDYGLEGRTFTVFNETKYDYDSEDDERITPIDRCVVFSGNQNKNIPQQPRINWKLKEYTGQQPITDWS